MSEVLRARHYDPTTGQFTTLDPLVALSEDPYGYSGGNPANWSDPTGLWCALGKNPNGSCRGSGAVETVKETASDGWDATGGRAVSIVDDAAQDTGEFVVRNRGTIITGFGVATCIAASLGACAAATAVAFAVRSEQAISAHPDGWSGARTSILTDAAITAATFGLVSAPASRSFAGATGGYLVNVERGLFWGAPSWQSYLARLLTATPDLAGLLGSYKFHASAC